MTEVLREEMKEIFKDSESPFPPTPTDGGVKFKKLRKMNTNLQAPKRDSQ